MKKTEITQKILKQLLRYDKSTGKFTWREKPAGTNKDGYVSISLFGKLYPAHRLAWLYEYGEWPKNVIDHVNRVKNDNRILNLRDCTLKDNGKNRTKSKSNTSGYKGVYQSSKNRWIAVCRINGKSVRVGHFKSTEEAAEAYKNFAQKHHGEFYCQD